jgi:crossover junction endodeoxyribonuclease RuvC
VARLLGVDPGLNKAGWGIIDVSGNNASFVACGTIKTTPKDSLPARIKVLHHELSKVIEHYSPEEAAIEETFVNKNPQSSLKLGQARGALILTLGLAQLPVTEYSATHIKKSVVGTGRAAKDQISTMVKILLPTAKMDGPDAADALAIALTHAHQRDINKLLENA